MARILIVEDEEKIARFVELELTHEGHEVAKAADGRAGVEAALDQDFDLILLDVMLPQLNGLEVLRRLRRAKTTPVILLTARDAVMDKVSGLDAGADDYITKPFAIEELLARIRVALKHHGADAPAGTEPAAPGFALANERHASHTPADDATRTVGAITLNPLTHEATVHGNPLALTGREFDVLQMLIEHPNRVITREQLMRDACGYEFVGDTNPIDVHVSHIRSKIEKQGGDAGFISTVRGVGYVIRTR